jgi:hypothetical protein
VLAVASKTQNVRDHHLRRSAGACAFDGIADNL